MGLQTGIGINVSTGIGGGIGGGGGGGVPVSVFTVTSTPVTIPNGTTIVRALPGAEQIGLPEQNGTFESGIFVINRSGGDVAMTALGLQFIDGDRFFNIPDSGWGRFDIDTVTPGWYGSGGTATTPDEFNTGGRTVVGAP